jgi:serine/threonine protein kinase
LNGSHITLRPIFKEIHQNITLNSFEIIRCIGSGGFSSVYLCRFKEDGKFYAMKVIDKTFIVKNKKKKIVINERNIMAELNHPLLAKMYFAF